MDIVSKLLLEDGARIVPKTENINSEKEVNGLQLDPIFPKQGIADLLDLSKKIVLYQKMEDKWGDLDEMIELEEGEFLAESGAHSEDDETHPREMKVFAPLFSQDTLIKDPPVLEAVKEDGVISKLKPN